MLMILRKNGGENWEGRPQGVALPKPPIHNLEVKKRFPELFERPSVSKDVIMEDIPPTMRGLPPWISMNRL
jgi:hypothetical protein